MNRKNILILMITAFILALIIYYVNQCGTLTGNRASALEESDSKVSIVQFDKIVDPGSNSASKQAKKFVEALNKSFIFYGKVVDDKGDAISNAEVLWEAANNPDPYGPGIKGKVFTQADGTFLVNSRGLQLYVSVSKLGYYKVPTVNGGLLGSYDGFTNMSQRTKTDRRMGTKEEPTIFLLRKKGEADSLIKIKTSIKVPRDSVPVEIDLRSGKVVMEGKGDLKIETWTYENEKNNEGHYNWRCLLSVPLGGMVERKGPFEFEAPVTGYRENDEMVMLVTSEEWLPQLAKEYFIKLSDNIYARIEFEIVAGGDHFVSIISYLNPTSGSRNLEYDPAKEVKP